MKDRGRFERSWYWMAEHPMLTILLIACIQGLIVDIFGLGA